MKKINYEMISLLQFVFSISVIMLHSSRLFENEAFHFIQNSVFSQMAVPFFMICSSYLVKAKSSRNSKYQKNYFVKNIKQYILWSLAYLPFGYLQINSLSLPAHSNPFAIFATIFTTGTYSHLWYIPAFLAGFYLVNKFKKKINLKYMIILFVILYLIGSIETYPFFLENTKVFVLLQDYSSLFSTSKSGLLFAPFYIYLGILLYDFRNKKFFKNNFLMKLLLSLLFLGLEGSIIFPNQGFDKNYLLSLVPVSLFLFNWSVRTSLFKNKSFKKLKGLSTLYFFIHPIFIDLISIPIFQSLFHPTIFGWVSFSFALVCTHFTATFIQRLKPLEIAIGKS